MIIIFLLLSNGTTLLTSRGAADRVVDTLMVGWPPDEELTAWLGSWYA